MKSIRIRNKGGCPINTPTWTDFGRRKEEEIGGAVAQMKASRRSDGSGGERRERWGLAHLGLSAHCVGDMTTPPVSSSDLLIASASPGGFSTVDAICGVAKTNGARVLVLTAQPESGSSVKYASVVAYTLLNYKIATLIISVYDEIIDEPHVHTTTSPLRKVENNILDFDLAVALFTLLLFWVSRNFQIVKLISRTKLFRRSQFIMESNDKEPTETQTQSQSNVRMKSDKAWDYATPATNDKGKKIIICDFCQKVISGGGINRFKKHLAGVSGDIASCNKVTPEVRFTMQGVLKETNRREKCNTSGGGINSVTISDDDEDTEETQFQNVKARSTKQGKRKATSSFHPNLLSDREIDAFNTPMTQDS
ncbi:hypothetical protein LXL04_025724 [Taraxacum kok-saghyz]